MTPENFISVMDFISFILALISIILAIVAIVLSITLYFKSSGVSKETRAAAGDIKGVVDQLQILFDKLHSESFSMLKDTHSGMIKRLFSTDTKEDLLLDDKVDKKTEEKLLDLSNEIKKDMANVLKTVDLAQGQINEIADSIQPTIEHALNRSSKVEKEAKFELLEEMVLMAIKKASDAGTSLKELLKLFPGDSGTLRKAILKLQRREKIFIHGKEFFDDTLITQL